MTDDLAPPVREQTPEFQCRCLVIAPSGETNACTNETLGPDHPFCSACEERHPNGWPPEYTVTVRQGVTR